MKKYSFTLFLLFLLILTAPVTQAKYTPSVLAEKTEQKEQKEQKEEIEQPEPAETPEPEEENEKETEKVREEVKKEVESKRVEKVEIGEGTIKLEKVDGTSMQKSVPASKTSLISVQNNQAGAVSISVGKNGVITIVNEGVSVQTEFPVIIDPKTGTVAIKTTNGVTLVNSLPSQAMRGLKTEDKPTIVKSAVLGAQDGKPYYNVKGTQQGKLFGLIPVNTNIETKIDAQNGLTISVDRPWYLSLLGFLYSI